MMHICQGLEELFLGLDNARESGEDELFRDMLAARDTKGYFSKYLMNDTV